MSWPSDSHPKDERIRPLELRHGPGLGIAPKVNRASVGLSVFHQTEYECLRTDALEISGSVLSNPST